MQYIEAKWNHKTNDPICFLYEIDDQRIPIRLIEIYRDGTKLAKYYIDSQPIEMTSIPEIEEINNDEQFNAEYVSEGHFEELWDESLIL